MEYALGECVICIGRMCVICIGRMCVCVFHLSVPSHISHLYSVRDAQTLEGYTAHRQAQGAPQEGEREKGWFSVGLVSGLLSVDSLSIVD